MNRSEFTQNQREALLNLLVFSMYPDSRLSLKEDDELQKLMEEIGWDSKTSREIFFLASIRRARDAFGDDHATQAYIDGRATAFADPAARSLAFETIQFFLKVDGLADAETSFWGKLKRGLLL